MLVLSRHEDQRIFVGPDICITLVKVDRGKVRLGIDAPVGLLILREELAPPDWIAAHARQQEPPCEPSSAG